MVIWRSILIIPDLFAQAQPERRSTLLEELSPLNQLRVIVGLFTVVILGLVIFIVIKAGSHMFRGFSAAAKRLPGDSIPNEDDWTNRPLNELLDDDG